MAGAGSGNSTSGECDPARLSSDPHHCGRCDHSCLGGACQEGVCQAQVLVELGTTGATALTLDEDWIWWVSPLSRMRRDGTGYEILAETRGSVWGVAADDRDVYWTTTSHEGLLRANKSTLDVGSLGVTGYRVAVDDESIYTAWQSVWRVSKETGEATELAALGGQGIAVDDADVFFTTWSPGGVYRVSKTGGEVVLLAEAQYSSYVAEYDDRVYWSVQAGGGVFSVQKEGGEVAQIAAGATPYGIAADQSGVYWADFDTGEIWMLASGATAPQRLAADQFNPRDLAVDRDAVYWTNDSIYSAISKVAKP